MDLILLVVILIFLFGGGYGSYHAYNRWGPNYGYSSVVGILIVVLVVWLLFGNLHARY